MHKYIKAQLRKRIGNKAHTYVFIITYYYLDALHEGHHMSEYVSSTYLIATIVIQVRSFDSIDAK